MNAAHFTDNQIAAFRTLVDLWGTDSVALIGASALGCYIDMRWRKTHDLDLSLSVSIDEYPAGLDQVAGWVQDRRMEHEWTSPDGVKVDVLPCGKELLDAGELVWPKSGFRMSLVGLRHAFGRSELIQIGDGLKVRVAPVSVVALLKMVANLDRPHERERDLQDLSYLLDEYLLDDEDRRFAQEIIERDLTFEDTNAFLLGTDIAAMADDAERQIVSGFFDRLQDDQDPLAARMLHLAPAIWRETPQVLVDRVRAFQQGFEATE